MITTTDLCPHNLSHAWPFWHKIFQHYPLLIFCTYVNTSKLLRIRKLSKKKRNIWSFVWSITWINVAETRTIVSIFVPFVSGSWLSHIFRDIQSVTPRTNRAYLVADPAPVHTVWWGRIWLLVTIFFVIRIYDGCLRLYCMLNYSM